MIWTIKITLLGGAYATSQWVRVFEMDAATDQESLHYLIQRTIGFDDDHLYDFFVARTPRSRGLIGLDGEGDAFCEKTLAGLFPLPKDRKLFYYFDYGDSWVFQVARTRKAPFNPRPGTHYPHLIEKIGENPDQYGKCQEDCEEDEDEDKDAGDGESTGAPDSTT